MIMSFLWGELSVIWFSIEILIFSFWIHKKIPSFYIKAKESVICASIELEKEVPEIKTSWIAAMVFTLPALLIYILSKDKEIAAITFVLGILAYFDLTTRWIPDCLLYGTVWLSLGLNAEQLLIQGVISAVLFTLPALILQGYSFLTRRKGVFASGDLYLLPAIGVWFLPELASGIMACALMLASFVSRYEKRVPFITCILPIFIGYEVCECSFLF
ncbi:hypothetical protein WB91_08765 [bacteria symbiont BFo1 of Frankliniella occidentalis]|nr:hypothetical protein WB91_08765 [bacteria symbiont BFo1 of Frankliniella occidentalis]